MTWSDELNNEIDGLKPARPAEEAEHSGEEKYRLIAENVTDIIWTVDMNLRFTFISPSVERMRGLSVREAMSQEMDEVLTPASLQMAMSLLAEELDRERSQGPDPSRSMALEFEEYRKDGSTIWTENTLTFLRNAKLEPIGILGVTRDVTARKLAEEALRESEGRFRTLFEYAPDSYYLYDLDGRLIDGNKAAERMIGCPKEKLIGRSLLDLNILPANELDRVVDILSRNRKSMPTGPDEIVMNRMDGSRVTVEVSTFPVEYMNETVVLGIAHNITERKRAEEEIQYRLEIERLTNAISSRFINLDQEQVDVEITQALGTLGMFTKSDRSYLFLFHDDVTLMSNTHEWCRDGVEPQIESLQGMPVESIPWWMDKLKWDENIIIHRIADLPEEASAERGILQSQGIISLLGVPLFYSNKLTGFLGFDSVLEEKQWPPWDIELLRTVGNVFMNALMHKKASKERSALEEQLRQSQKMESIGRLAGGIAHDFNNILTGIIGYSEVLLATMEPQDPIYTDISEIKAAADRAADLTYQLLAFSRKQIISPKVINLNNVVVQSTKMLNRIIGEDVELNYCPDENLGVIIADPSQLSQVLVNLAANARDAMPGGGSLRIKTSNEYHDEEYCRKNHDSMPGAFVLLQISDTGEGMDEETKKNIFEPFFTTKNKDSAIGLGLATVYGIVKQHNGYIVVESEPGAGTTFKIFFPMREGLGGASTEDGQNDAVKGTETILLVEDEEMVRSLARKILERNGYKVFEARNGGDAILIYGREAANIDLLLTDVVMPNMNGRELYERIRKIKSDIRVLYISGYTSNVIEHHGVLDQGTFFIRKPYSSTDLLKKVREVLRA